MKRAETILAVALAALLGALPIVVADEAPRADTWSLEIDTRDGNAWIADYNLTIDDCANAARAVKQSADIVDVVCVPESL